MEKKNKKNISIFLIVIGLVLIIGGGVWGFLLGQNTSKNNSANEENNTEPNNNEENTNTENNESSNEENTENNNEENPNTANNETNDIIKDITSSVKENTENDNIYVVLQENEIPGEVNTNIVEVYINNKKVIEEDPSIWVGTIYQIENNYLITTDGNAVNHKHLLLYDDKGSLLQDINELEDNNMVIASSDKYSKVTINNNVIELYGTRLMDGSSLVYNIDGEQKWIVICDIDNMSKVPVDDNYVVVAKYQLIYSNNKFEIKRISGTEETLGDHKAICQSDN